MSGIAREVTTFQRDIGTWAVNIVRDYKTKLGREYDHHFFVDVEVDDRLDWKQAEALGLAIVKAGLHIKHLKVFPDELDDAS